VTTVECQTLSGEWPSLMSVDQGRMLLDGCDVEQIAARYGTPVWVISLRTVASNFSHFVDTWSRAYPQVEVAYSVKANHLLTLVQLLGDLGASFDTTGETELQIARFAGVAPTKLILNGNGKSDAALLLAARDGARQVNLDSMQELRRLEHFAEHFGSRVDCAVRVQLRYRRLLELDPSFDEMLKVWESKFGVSVVNGEARKLVDAVAASRHTRFVGLHHHVGFSAVTGSYKPDLDIQHHREAVRELCEFAATLDVPPERLDIGGGFPVGSAIGISTSGENGTSLYPIVPLQEYAEAVAGVVREMISHEHLPLLQLEAGRFQVQNAGVFLTRAVDVKPLHADPPRTVITVDGSMQQCTQLGFGRTRPAPAVLGKDPMSVKQLCDVVGQTCVYDALVESIELPTVEPGDLLMFPSHGAYTDVSGTNFNAMPRPACVVVDGGRSALAKRRETLLDVIGRHSGRVLNWEQQ
jgi:diaminopimelate decarboxylase